MAVWGACANSTLAPCDGNAEAEACSDEAKGKGGSAIAVIANVAECLFKKAFGTTTLDATKAGEAYNSVYEAMTTCGNPDEVAVSILSLHKYRATHHVSENFLLA